MAPVFCLVLTLGACQRKAGADTPSGADGTVTLVLNTEVLGAPRSGADDGFPDEEKMETLRIVILHADGTVEYNRLLDFGAGLQTACTQLVKVREAETKAVYLIANEASVPGLDNMELDGFAAGDAGFGEKVGNLSFVPDYAGPSIPMSAMYEVEVGQASKECRFYLVRAATKFTFRFKNMRSGPVTVNSIAVSDIAGHTYLMPRKKSPTMRFREADGSESELFWITWLKRVSDESQRNPDDRELADKRGWIMDYDIPAGTLSDRVTVPAPDNFRVAGFAYDMGVPKPGTAV